MKPTIQEAIEDMEARLFCHTGIADHPEPKRVAVLELTLEVLREKQERENPEPLTIAELRQMDGEPVYLHTFSSVQRKTNIAQWAIIEAAGDANAVFLRAGCNSRLTKWFCNYGKTWNAYRHKPKEKGGT